MAETQKGFGKTLFSVGGLVLVLIVTILVNVVFSTVTFRWDTTEDSLYSLSEGTKEVLKQIETPIDIKVFYTRSLSRIPPNIKTYAGRVLDFLKEYENFADGKISVTLYDPKPDSEEEEWAQKYGIKGISLPEGDTIYLGLVASCRDQEETVPFLDPAGEQRLEYDITRIISRVQRPEKLKIGIISGLPVFGQSPMAFGMQDPGGAMSPWLFIRELRKSYVVREIVPASETLGEDIDLLLIIHPGDLNAQLAFAVDQYILKGNNAMIFLDPFSTQDQSPGGPVSPSMEKLLASWGVEIEPGKTVVDFNHATRLRAMNNQIELNPAWLSLTAASLNASNLITSELESMLLPMAGAFKKKAESQAAYEALVQTSSNAALEESFKMRFGAEGLRQDFKAGIKPFDLAVQVSGTFQSAYPQGPPEQGTEEKAGSSPQGGDSGSWIKASEKPSTLILVGDSDFLFDGYYVSKQNFLGFDLTRIFNDNLNFLLNAVEMISGGENLIGIRSRGRFERPFTRVQMLEQRAQERWLEQEQELVRKVEETNRKLAELEKQKDDTQRLIVSDEQEAEIRRFKEERQRINQELKLVRRNLRAEIESLGSRVKFVNIFLMPLFVSAAGIGYALYSRRKSNQS